jgi:hypothetical protein
MIYFLTCRDYTVIARAPFDCSEAPAICERLEDERNDGYAVVAYRDGTQIADACGYTDHTDGGPPYDAATATGMYD